MSSDDKAFELIENQMPAEGGNHEFKNYWKHISTVYEFFAF
jgi:ADP-glucose pyrophosphorylase